MVRYFYAWGPFVIVGTVLLLTLPYLGVIALAVFTLVALATLAALAWAIVSVPRALGRAIAHRWQDRTAASPQTAAAMVPANRQSV